MQVITSEKLLQLVGGGNEITGEGYDLEQMRLNYEGEQRAIQTVTISASRESAASARENYETAMGLANIVTAAAGIGAGLAVNGACSGGAALIGGAIGGPPGALATAAATKSSCGWISGIVGGGVGTYTSGHLTKYINNM